MKSIILTALSFTSGLHCEFVMACVKIKRTISLPRVSVDKNRSALKKAQFFKFDYNSVYSATKFIIHEYFPF